jgi:hypothetical protein
MRFISKNNVYLVDDSKAGTSPYSLEFVGDRLPFKFIDNYLGSRFISKRATGRGSYFYTGGRLFLALKESDIEQIINPKKTTLEPKLERKRIPDDVQKFVWNRDGGICVKCGTNENLAFDHIIPHSRGGSDTKRNLQILCDKCNLKKGNKIGG